MEETTSQTIAISLLSASKIEIKHAVLFALLFTSINRFTLRMKKYPNYEGMCNNKHMITNYKHGWKQNVALIDCIFFFCSHHFTVKDNINMQELSDIHLLGNILMKTHDF